MRTVAALGLAVTLVAAPVEAQWNVHGHAKAQLSVQHFPPGSLGSDILGTTPVDALGDGRIHADRAWRRLDVTADAELMTLLGDTTAASRQLPGSSAGGFLTGLPDLSDRHQAFDLGWTIRAGDRTTILGRLDRLSVAYTGDHAVVRLGRQALSWGNGLVFQTLDLFNPFPPNVIDVDYKPGRDMLTTQWLFANGDDVQAIAVPGRRDRDHPVSWEASSVAAKWHHFAGAAEVEFLVARHDGDTVVGGGLAHSVAGGVWRLDLSHTRTADAAHVTSLLTNFDHGWVPGGRSLYAFGEYFYNGFGVDTGGPRPIVLNPALFDRLERGELFSLGRHELAGGLQFQWTPLLLVSPTVIVNLGDGSAFALAQLRYDWRQNVILYAGVQAGLGARGTEFGGVATASLPGDLAPGTRAWTRLAWYF